MWQGGAVLSGGVQGGELGRCGCRLDPGLPESGPGFVGPRAAAGCFSTRFFSTGLGHGQLGDLGHARIP